ADRRHELVAQSHKAPWTTLRELSDYASRSPQPAAMLRQVFRAEGPQDTQRTGKDEYGIWTYRGRIYQVVAVPMIFEEGGAEKQAAPEGALIMAIALTDELAAEL